MPFVAPCFLTPARLRSAQAQLRSAEAATEAMRAVAQPLHQAVTRSQQHLNVAGSSFFFCFFWVRFLTGKQRAEGSAQTLLQLKREYVRHDEAVVKGKQLTERLKQREFTDRILTGLGLLVFVLVVLYILKSRLIPRVSLLSLLGQGDKKSEL